MPTLYLAIYAPHEVIYWRMTPGFRFHHMKTHPNTDMILDPNDIPSLLRPNLSVIYPHFLHKPTESDTFSKNTQKTHQTSLQFIWDPFGTSDANDHFER